jgi:hypothetical protein
MSKALPAGDAALARDEDAACWQAAKQIREEHPRWVVIWLARIGQFRAYPKFAAPRGTAPTAKTPGELTAQMEHVEHTARRPTRQVRAGQRSLADARALHDHTAA